MNVELKERIKAIQKIFIAHYEAGKGMANASIGLEREVFVRELLKKIYPNGYRFSSGDIVDRTGNRTGQVDLALEFPHEPTFPSPVGDERLMIAESVIVAFEIKSSWNQLGEVKTKCEKVNNLDRALNWVLRSTDKECDPRFPTEVLEINERIPLIAVFYSGPTNLETVTEAYNDLREHIDRPTAILTLDRGHFVYRATEMTGEDGIFAMLCLVTELSNKIASSLSSLTAYL